MSDEVRIAFNTWARFDEAPVADATLAAFESVASFSPTHWGKDEFARLPYDHAAILEAVRGGAFGVALYLARKKPVRHLAAFAANRALHPSLLRAVWLMTKGGCPPPRLADAFALGDALAAAVTPELGYVHRFASDLGDRTDLYNQPTGMSAGNMQEFGLEGLYARSYLGAELTRRLGRDRLEATGCAVRDAPWGGVVLDLVPEPWKASAEALFEAQQRAVQVLRASGMFGVYEGIRGVSTEPGPAWSPLPSPWMGGA